MGIELDKYFDLDKENINPETLYARYFLASCYEKIRMIDKAIEQWTIIYKRNKTFRDVSAKLSKLNVPEKTVFCIRHAHYIQDTVCIANRIFSDTI